ncbi:LacI family transcriptional regulator [bacterium]|nr:LacI family transcriptional regulator [bacterium]
MNIKDIAKLANTSISTVSRSLNDSDLVAASTKKRILEIAKGVDFEFNASARGLVTRNTGTIGIILPDEYDKFSTNLYHSTLHNDLRKSLERADKDLIVAFCHNRFSGKSNIHKLVTRKKVDGLIIIQPDLDKNTLAFLEEQQIPFVLTHYPPKSLNVNYDVIYTDQEHGGFIVGEHLVHAGYKKIVCISSDTQFKEEFRWREKGVRRALTLHQMDLSTDSILLAGGSFASGYKAVQKNSSRIKQADAVFAFNDLLALGAMRAMQEMGIRIPDDIALVGYDDTPLAEFANPLLTSVHQPREELALLTCEHLFELIDKVTPDAKSKTRKKKIIGIQPRLIVRESCPV